MIDLYCIPGYGTDKRFFKHLKLKHYKQHFIEWPEPERNDTLGAYADKIIAQIDTSNPFSLLGISLGGFLAVELSSKINPQKVFVISSLKSSKEFPGYWALFRWFGVSHFINAKTVKVSKWLIEPIFGKMTKDDKKIMNQMIDDTPNNFTTWAPKAISKWKSNDHLTPFKKIIHIIGDKDLLYSKSKIKDCHLIKNGSHLMIFDRAAQIGKLIDSEG
ncbi:MAG: alpha/beta hydrolase [Pedobacter sp.]|nr:alpha/beta hydrolase [Pedobacter sp.]